MSFLFMRGSYPSASTEDAVGNALFQPKIDNPDRREVEGGMRDHQEPKSLTHEEIDGGEEPAQQRCLEHAPKALANNMGDTEKESRTQHHHRAFEEARSEKGLQAIEQKAAKDDFFGEAGKEDQRNRLD